MAGVGGGALLVLAFACHWLVRRSLRPLGEIEQTAQAIAGGDLSRRVPERDSRTEMGQLGAALNGMLAQIERAVGSGRRRRRRRGSRRRTPGARPTTPGTRRS
ncbi:HAMP domain-containing protein [Nonomuraea sp. NBC_01738]|uniref:HAMP domain-containing protein n=1 Tax=Nonomuraea sp. NBC_01738 TaxID=2976003 RepID=UPI002E12FF2C|nr:HAMP domain-containing protein [Nonomuraea sp. NBC_01738]